MLKLATLLDNPGEPQARTRYRDPRVLAELGYNGRVLYATTALSGVESADAAGDGEIRRWVEQQFERAQQAIDESRQAGLEVYITYDVLSLPRADVERVEANLCCKGRPTSLCPASDAALERSAKALRALLARWPQLAGVVLRFGDNDGARLPYLIGNDVYQPHCPRCSQLGRVDRVARVLNRFHGLVVGELGKRLIARAWNVRPNGMHDSPDVCRRLRDQLPGADNPGDDRFVLSFKFTETDFWRYQKWNPASQAFGERPILYELQCQREFEGKGGIPNWQAPLWRDGYPESQPGKDEDRAAGLAEAAQRVNLAGLWAWVRGGGWGGPFVKNETWIDANVYAAPLLADRPDADVGELADQWIRDQLGVDDAKVAAAIRGVLEHSPEVIRQGFYIGPFAEMRGSAWHPNGDLIQDDLIDADAAWRMVQRLPDSRADEAVAEKQRAVEQLDRDHAALHALITDSTRGVLEPMCNTLVYGAALFRTLEHLLAGLIAYRRYQKKNDAAQALLCRQRLLAAQSDWAHHTQRTATAPGTATAFRESHFWELTQRLIAEVEPAATGVG